MKSKRGNKPKAIHSKSPFRKGLVEPYCERDEFGNVHYFDKGYAVTRNEFFTNHPGWDKPCLPWCELGKKGTNEYHTTSGRIVPYNQFAVYYPKFDDTICRENLVSRLISSKKLTKSILTDKMTRMESMLKARLQETEENVAALQHALEEKLAEISQGNTKSENLQKAVAGLKNGLSMCKKARRVAEDGLRLANIANDGLTQRLKELEQTIERNIAHTSEIEQQLVACKASEAQKGNMQKAIDGLKNSLKICKTARRDAESQLQSAISESNRMGNQLREMEGDLNVERTLKAEVQEEKAQLQSRLEALEASLAENVATLKGTEADMIRCRNLEVQQLDMSLAINGLKKSLKLCKDARKEAQDGLKSCMAEVNSMGQRYIELENTCRTEKTLLEERMKDCETGREGLQSRVDTLARQAEEYISTMNTLRGKGVDMESNIATLTNIRDSCIANSKLMEEQNARLQERLNEVESQIEKAGDACFASSSDAMACLDKMRTKFPEVAGLLAKAGKVESVVLKNGEEVILPDSIPLVEEIKGIPVVHEEEKKELIPIRPSELSLSKDRKVKTSIKKEGRGDLLAAIRGTGIGGLRKTVDNSKREDTSPRGFSGADLASRAKLLKKRMSKEEEESLRKACLEEGKSDMRREWVQSRQSCEDLTEEQYKAKCDRLGFPYIWKDGTCVSGLAARRKAFVEDEDEDWE
jgi:chromosome segregation ATPase